MKVNPLRKRFALPRSTTPNLFKLAQKLDRQPDLRKVLLAALAKVKP